MQNECYEALKDLLEQLRGIGIPDWRGAEGLSLEQAEAAIQNHETEHAKDVATA